MAGFSPAKGGVGDEDSKTIDVADDSLMESEIAKLRGRWELASVLNFLSVFEPVIGNDLKLTAEEIETALVKPNISLARLHITLLKGIPPVSKQLNVSGVWVTALCKKLPMWWPWVAKGEIPLKIANGEEIRRYEELDPISRLLILKALCEIRSDQVDAVSYINDAMKKGTKISCFRKDRVGGDGNVTSYWCDGNAVIGHRLYKEVFQTELNSKTKGKPSESLNDVCFLWETVATNVEEFQKAVDKLSTSNYTLEVAVGETIVNDVLPSVVKFQKKKDRALKQKQRQGELLSNFRSLAAGITRSCRTSRPVSYTYEEYDRAIDEATEPLESDLHSRKRQVEKPRSSILKRRNLLPGEDGDTDIGTESLPENGDCDKDLDPENQNGKNENILVIEHEKDRLEKTATDDKDSDDDYNGEGEDDDDDDGDVCESFDSENDIVCGQNCDRKPIGSRRSQRLAGVEHHPAPKEMQLGAKNRLRQRPTRNSAIELVVPDSDDDDNEVQVKHADKWICT